MIPFTRGKSSVLVFEYSEVDGRRLLAEGGCQREAASRIRKEGREGEGYLANRELMPRMQKGAKWKFYVKYSRVF